MQATALVTGASTLARSGARAGGLTGAEAGAAVTDRGEGPGGARRAGRSVPASEAAGQHGLSVRPPVTGGTDFSTQADGGRAQPGAQSAPVVSGRWCRVRRRR